MDSLIWIVCVFAFALGALALLYIPIATAVQQYRVFHRAAAADVGGLAPYRELVRALAIARAHRAAPPPPGAVEIIRSSFRRAAERRAARAAEHDVRTACTQSIPWGTVAGLVFAGLVFAGLAFASGSAGTSAGAIGAFYFGFAAAALLIGTGAGLVTRAPSRRYVQSSAPATFRVALARAGQWAEAHAQSLAIVVSLATVPLATLAMRHHGASIVSALVVAVVSASLPWALVGVLLHSDRLGRIGRAIARPLRRTLYQPARLLTSRADQLVCIACVLIVGTAFALACAYADGLALAFAVPCLVYTVVLVVPMALGLVREIRADRATERAVQSSAPVLPAAAARAAHRALLAGLIPIPSGRK